MKTIKSLILSILCTTALISQTQTYDENIRMSMLERQATKQFVEKMRKYSIGYALASSASLSLIGYIYYLMGYKITFKINLETIFLPWLSLTLYNTYNNLQIEALEAELNKLSNKK